MKMESIIMRKIEQVSIQKRGGFNLLDIEDFFDIPSVQRVELVLKSKILFLDEDGEIVPIKEGVRFLTGSYEKFLESGL